MILHEKMAFRIFEQMKIEGVFVVFNVGKIPGILISSVDIVAELTDIHGLVVVEHAESAVKIQYIRMVLDECLIHEVLIGIFFPLLQHWIIC